MIRKVVIFILLAGLLGGLIFDTSNKMVTSPRQESIAPKNGKVILQSKVPVLMYHSIADVNSELCVSPADFKAQMKWLAANNYNPITLSQLYYHWEEGEELPVNPIVLTFDDGYADNYTIAYKVMREHGFIGVLFIYAKKFTTRNSVSEQQLLEMQHYGWEVGNHSYTHPELPKVTDQQLIKETSIAKDELSQVTGSSILAFCYPAGKYNDQVVQAVRNAGHKIAVTTNYGFSEKKQGLLTLSRVRINRSDRVSGFIKKLT